MIQLESEAAIGEDIIIPFEFNDLSSLPEGKDIDGSITIRPITVRTWFKLKPYLISFDNEDLEKIIQKKDSYFDSDVQVIMAKYDNLIFDIVCIGINNRKKNMDDWYKEVLKDNCTWKDIYILFNAIFFRLNFNPFFNTIILSRSVSLLSEEEIIALQKNKETWNLKVASCF